MKGILHAMEEQRNRIVPTRKRSLQRAQTTLQCNYLGAMPIDNEDTSFGYEEPSQNSPTGSGFEPFQHCSNVNADG